MTKEQLDEAIELTKKDSKFFSDNGKHFIFNYLKNIYTFSKEMYDKYRVCLDLDWVPRIGLAQWIDITGYKDDCIYLNAYYEHDNIVRGDKCVIKIDDILKYNSKEFKQEFIKTAKEKRIRQLDENIKDTYLTLEKYKEEKLNLEYGE